MPQNDKKNTTLFDLPTELLQRIFLEVGIKNKSAVARSCSFFNKINSEEGFWKLMMSKYYPDCSDSRLLKDATDYKTAFIKQYTNSGKFTNVGSEYALNLMEFLRENGIEPNASAVFSPKL